MSTVQDLYCVVIENGEDGPESRTHRTSILHACGHRAGASAAPEGANGWHGESLMQFLRRCLNKAVRDGQMASNPVCQVKMFKEPEGKTRFLSPAEEAALGGKLGPTHAEWVRLAILTGMRQLEQLILRWEHVDLERGVLTLPTTKAGGCNTCDSMKKRKS